MTLNYINDTILNKNGTLRKVISFSLWGSNPKYILGFVENLRLANILYQDWEIWCYADLLALKSLDYQIKLSNLHVDSLRVIIVADKGDFRGTFWRFLPFHSNTVDVFISRDSDSRLSLRERFAVHEWELSSMPFHIMRDHPSHGFPILGGMWGCRPKELQTIGMNFSDKILVATEDRWGVDQDFLAKEVYPKVKHLSLVHDSIFEKRDFPVERIGDEFVGEAFEANGARNEQAVLALRNQLGLATL